MSGRILVAYATATGSTEGVAEAIGKTLANDGTQVDVRPVREVHDLTPYTAVVAGSAIHDGKWLPEAMQFVEDHRAELSQKPFAAFLVCITMSMENEQYRKGVAEWMAPVRALVKPISEGYFAGVLDFTKMPRSLNTLLMRFTVWTGTWKSGDHRDWLKIQQWAASLKPLLETRNQQPAASTG